MYEFDTVRAQATIQPAYYTREYYT